MNLADLAAEFPRDAIHWRAQTLTRNGDKALALAYLDARDVMDRLDEVCGPANWQTSYTETPKGRVLCSIGIRVGEEWVWKSDGAGDTAVEGEKGGISDSLKRAAVQWGIGRYLYRLDAVWAPCETYERNGKPQWKAWKGSPWDSVRRMPTAGQAQKPAETPKESPFDHRAEADVILKQIDGCIDAAALRDTWIANNATLKRIEADKPPMFKELVAAKDKAKASLSQPSEAPEHEYQ